MKAQARSLAPGGPTGRRGDPTVLIIGGGDPAAAAVLDLCVENRVTLCSARASLSGMTLEHRYQISELAFENEIDLRLRVAVERVERLESGRWQVDFRRGGPEPAVYDAVIDLSRDTLPGSGPRRSPPGPTLRWAG
jgi:hypothetical protein